MSDVVESQQDYTPHEREIYSRAYVAGHSAGFDRGYQVALIDAMDNETPGTIKRKDM